MFAIRLLPKTSKVEILQNTVKTAGFVASQLPADTVIKAALGVVCYTTGDYFNSCSQLTGNIAPDTSTGDYHG